MYITGKLVTKNVTCQNGKYSSFEALTREALNYTLLLRLKKCVEEGEIIEVLKCRQTLETASQTLIIQKTLPTIRHIYYCGNLK